jgi:hypothetical protein
VCFVREASTIRLHEPATACICQSKVVVWNGRGAFPASSKPFQFHGMTYSERSTGRWRLQCPWAVRTCFFPNHFLTCFFQSHFDIFFSNHFFHQPTNHSLIIFCDNFFRNLFFIVNSQRSRAMGRGAGAERGQLAAGGGGGMGSGLPASPTGVLTISAG